LGARGALPRERVALPAQGCLTNIPAPPAAPPRQRGSLAVWQSSDALRRENAEVWLFENSNQRFRVPGAMQRVALREELHAALRSGNERGDDTAHEIIRTLTCS
jgi:hypothetical protein